jgi:molybdate transport system substrate-binding protein
MPTRRATLSAAALLAAAAAGGALAQEAPVIAVAASAMPAVEEASQAFRAAGGGAVRLVPGSSGNLMRQIVQGAPFQLFLSADETFVLQLAESGHVRDRGVPYAVGRLGLFVPNGSPLAADGSLADLRARLAAGSLTRFAIANPDTAPYGRAAREALMHQGLWAAIVPHLVIGENVAQAVQFAASGNAQGGLIPRSLGQSPAVAARGRFVPIPEAWHAPLRQRMALTRAAGPVAAAFLAFLAGPEGRAIFVRRGFLLPDDG